MKLKQLRLKNFRGYDKEVAVDFNQLTAFVGKNDVGKSTILEALDICFNDNKGTVKLDNEDFSINSSDSKTVIKFTLVFSDLPYKIVLEDTCETTLGSEFLVNSYGDLEVIKEFKTPTSCVTKIKAKHPTNKECSNLLFLKQKELQQKVEMLGLDCDDKRKSSLMRKAIWNHYSTNLDKAEVELDVSTKEGDLKDIWDKLQGYLPFYALFQSDRRNSDNDEEIQEPLKLAVKQFLKKEEIEKTLNDVAKQVIEHLQEVADSTLNKLQEMNPELAKSLHPILPNISSLKWQDVFKNISISGDQNIPINKRGSGVRRLILLNFFRAQAEKTLGSTKRQNIIYAIEEPETSQHYEHQQLLVKSLLQIASQPHAQVIITTHSGDIIKALNWDDIRLILNKDGEKIIKKVDEKYLPSPTVGEVSYCIFDMPNIEYHNELYGYLQSVAIEENQNNEREKEFDKWLFNNGLKMTRIWVNNKNGQNKEYQTTLQTYIRNMIHHPENTLNPQFSEKELNSSIEMMIGVAKRIKEQKAL